MRQIAIKEHIHIKLHMHVHRHAGYSHTCTIHTCRNANIHIPHTQKIKFPFIFRYKGNLRKKKCLYLEYIKTSYISMKGRKFTRTAGNRLGFLNKNRDVHKSINMQSTQPYKTSEKHKFNPQGYISIELQLGEKKLKLLKISVFTEYIVIHWEQE